MITGATGGIGKAVTEAFLNEGCRLALTSTAQEKMDKLLSDLGNPPEEAERFFADASYNKRYAKPEEVAYAALYLASEVSAHMMGWGLRLDGGKHII